MRQNYFVTRMLRHAAAMIDPPPSEKITWCYGEWEAAYATMDRRAVRRRVAECEHVRLGYEDPHLHRRSQGRNGRTGHELVH